MVTGSTGHLTTCSNATRGVAAERQGIIEGSVAVANITDGQLTRIIQQLLIIK